MKPDFDLAVYLVTDPHLCGHRGILATAVEAVQGGVTMVQLRDKRASDQDLITLGRALKKALQGTNARLIVNDRVEVAAAIDADGLHIGQGDIDARTARARLGSDAILGLSVETAQLARAADAGIVDYLGAGPVFATATKVDHAEPLGLDGLALLCSAAPLPIVAIGGLRADHAEPVIRTGAQGLALVSALCTASDPRAAARELRSRVDEARSFADA